MSEQAKLILAEQPNIDGTESAAVPNASGANKRPADDASTQVNSRRRTNEAGNAVHGATK